MNTILHPRTYSHTVPAASKKNVVLGMVVIRLVHTTHDVIENALQHSFAFTTANTQQQVWNVAMNHNQTNHELAYTLGGKVDSVNIMELWNESIPSEDKHVLIQELQKVIKNFTYSVNSSVITHSFGILNAVNGYHGFQWICSILPDTLGHVSRITATLRTILSPQSRHF